MELAGVEGVLRGTGGGGRESCSYLGGSGENWGEGGVLKLIGGQWGGRGGMGGF